MTAPRSAAPLWPRLLRGVAVGAVLLGYLGVLFGTSVGQGWRHLGHLATAQHSAFEAPRLQSPATPAVGPVLSTLRGHPHSHGAHSHRHPSAHPSATRTVRTALPAAEPAVQEGFHSHGGVLHSHDLPPPDPAPIVVHTLDHHRLPTPPATPTALAVPTREAGTAPTVVLASVVPSVEIPPPRGRA